MSIDFIEPEDFFDIHGNTSGNLSIDEAKLSMNVPIVVNYTHIDTGKTDFSFAQEFKKKDTEMYFKTMHDIACNTINDIITNSDIARHFLRTKITNRIYDLLVKLGLKKISREELLIFHFALYTDKDCADRKTDKRSPRIYFMLGKNGMIFPLFFDPYHEINP